MWNKETTHTKNKGKNEADDTTQNTQHTHNTHITKQKSCIENRGN